MEQLPDTPLEAKPQRRSWASPLHHLPTWLKNKYVIALLAFGTVMLFLDKNDLFTQYDRVKQLSELRKSKAYYTTKIEAERKDLEGIMYNPAILEKYAREKYFMKRDNEELFIIPEAGQQKK